MISRVLGFVRDVLLASLLGTGMVAEAYVVAFRFPNLFRRLFGEGAFNAAFVPLFAKRLEGEGKISAENFAAEVFSGLLFVLLLFLAFAELAMPLLMYLFAPGFADDAAKFDLTVVLTRIAFPYLVFMSLVAMLSGVLNSMHRFTAAAAAPIVLNVILIGLLSGIHFAGWGNSARSGVAIVWGVAFAGFAQFAMLWIAARKAGLRLKIQRPAYTPGVKRLVMLGIPGLVASGIAQLNLVISTIIASLQDHAQAWLYFADRVYQLPLGVIGVAIGVVLLPELSRRLRAGDEAGVHQSQNRSLEFSLFLTIPATFALMAIPFPIIQVLFERGAYGATDSHASALALGAYAAGLPAFVMVKIFSPGFFAREDTKTPMYFAGLSVATNIAMALILFPYFGHVGVAMSVSIAGWVNALALGITLTRKGHFRTDARLRTRLVKTIGISMIMGAVLLAGNYYTYSLFNSANELWLRMAVLGGLVVTGAAIFFVLAFATGTIAASELKGAVSRSANK